MEEWKGGCCIANYAGRGHVAPCDNSKMDMILMKFRPIAPKPPANVAATAASDGGDLHAKAIPGGRGRRKCRRKRKSCSPDRTAENPLIKAAVTLPLLPEAPDLSPTSNQSSENSLVLGDNCSQSHCPDRTALGAPRVVESYVIVEGITDTWTGDYQVMMNRIRLEEDKCPGFITDAWNNRVWWTNEAYRRMVMGDTWQDQKMAVLVMMREKVLDSQAFTCRVRVRAHRSGGGKESTGSSSTSTTTLTLPCDVWRIDGGGWFAWRLDVDAALSLGR